MKKIRIRNIAPPGAAEPHYGTGMVFIFERWFKDENGMDVEVKPLEPGEVMLVEDEIADEAVSKIPTLVEITDEPHTRAYPFDLVWEEPKPKRRRKPKPKAEEPEDEEFDPASVNTEGGES